MSKNPSAEADQRLNAIKDWLRDDLKLEFQAIEPASCDASFRRYFRVIADGTSVIVMDAPPQKEDMDSFVRIALLFAAKGIHVPNIFDQNNEQGFLLMSDLGRDCYLDQLDDHSADALYGDAMDALIRLQNCVDPEDVDLPFYDEQFLHRELEIFKEWFLGELLGIEISPFRASLLARLWKILTESALQQPRVCVHRDYHSRNLMVVSEKNPGVLDFQDAVVGPISYDIVSLLRDCYISWPEQQMAGWLANYTRKLKDEKLLAETDDDRFRRWFDLMGIQRHLKAVGIFSRLSLRDGKTGYLKDIPLTLGYIENVCTQYGDLTAFLSFFQDEVMPRFEKRAADFL